MTLDNCRSTSRNVSAPGPSWKASGFEHRLFDERTAAAFINSSLGARYKRVFESCYHPAMQADYFRLCYVLVKGGFYVDADDVCVSTISAGSPRMGGSNSSLSAMTSLLELW